MLGHDPTSAVLAVFYRGPLSWNLECCVFWKEEKRKPREKPSKQGENQPQTQPTYDVKAKQTIVYGRVALLV